MSATGAAGAIGAADGMAATGAAFAGNVIGLLLWALLLAIVFRHWTPWRGMRYRRVLGEERGDRRDDARFAHWHPLRMALWLALPPLAFLMRGLLGDLSFAAPVLAFWLAAPRTPTSARGLLLAALALSGIALLVSALGFLAADIYALGYRTPAFLCAVAAALAFAWFVARPLALAWLVGLSLHAVGITPSPNLWDTLIDLPTTAMAILLALRARRGTVAGEK